ncbi:MAG TPA: BTAD domain-containing putative transcriptional regulator [Gemmatimonadales bacterium]|nr:BTAD domain-containing putative transcriptional regulator [Gemmatimonadales bacterium]
MLHGGITPEVRLLGTMSVRVGAEREHSAVLAQPKRFALLAYLAAATPRGYHRRDTLLALFWPEADQEHARTSLRKAVHFLRQQLGPDLIVSRGDEEIGLAPAGCWSDVAAFEEALAAGRCDHALELYRGDLLPGLHFPDLPDLERWIEDTRTRLRERAVAAAWALASEDERNGRPAHAVRWVRRAMELSPYDEEGIRRLLTLQLRSGDRSGAVLAYDRFAQRLSVDLDLEPSPETRSIVEAARNGGGAIAFHAPEVLASAPIAASVTARSPNAVPPTTTSSSIPVRRHRARRAAVAALLALGATFAAGAVSLRIGSSPLPSSPPTPVAILPFDYRGTPDLEYLAEGMVDLLSTKLDGAPGVRPVDPRALLGFLGRKPAGDDLARGRRAAEHFGADRFVLGSIIEAGDRLQVSATLYDGHGRVQGIAEAQGDGEHQVFEMADQLARQILSEVQEKRLELARVADQTTSSLPALKAYIEGERELRDGRTADAAEAFQRATALDTSFALAHYRLALLAREHTVAREHVRRALRDSARLAEHQRELVKAFAAALRGEHKVADRLYRDVLAAHPDDVETWSMLANLIGYRGPLAGYAWVDAREAYERVLELDPRNALALWHLATFAAWDARLADLDSFTSRFLRLKPTPHHAGNIQGQRAVVRGDSAGIERFIADLRVRPDLSAQMGAGVVTMTTGDLTTGRRLWRLITEPTRSRDMRALAHVTLAKIELTTGRWEAAKAELERAATLDAASALEHRIYYALTRFLTLPRAELLGLRDSLERQDAPRGTEDVEGLAAMHRNVRSYLKLYLLGMLSARLGEPAAALGYASRLETADGSTLEGAFAHDQAQLVRVEVAWLGGRPEEALATLERADFWTTHSALDNTGDSPFFTRIHERFDRAELLYQLGRVDEARQWYRAFTYEMLYRAPSHYRLAQIHRAKGEHGKAREHYSRFVELWRDCDPMLRPMLQRALAEGEVQPQP